MSDADQCSSAGWFNGRISGSEPEGAGSNPAPASKHAGSSNGRIFGSHPEDAGSTPVPATE